MKKAIGSHQKISWKKIEVYGKCQTYREKSTDLYGKVKLTGKNQQKLLGSRTYREKSMDLYEKSTYLETELTGKKYREQTFRN